MTPDGVRSITDLDVGDEVYSLDPDTQDIDVKHVTDTIEKPNYSGELIDMSGDNTDLRMTPDHELLRWKGDELVTETAEELADMASFELPVHNARGGSGVSDTVDVLDEVSSDYPVVTDTTDGTEYITDGEQGTWFPRYVDRDTWVQLIGWYVTDGYTRRDDTLRVSRSLLAEQCEHRGQDVTLPEWVFDMSVERKELLFEVMMDSTESDCGYTCDTTSRQLRDDVLRLVTETGRMPSYRNDSECVNGDYCVDSTATDYTQRVTRESMVARTSTDDVETDGVYCVTVEDNHTLLAGRNGTFAHARNCHSDDNEFTYKLTPDSAEKRESEDVMTITRKAKPYWFLFAQFDTDFEMWNRLMKIPVHESESKNRAVFRMVGDIKHIQIGDDDQESAERGGAGGQRGGARRNHLGEHRPQGRQPHGDERERDGGYQRRHDGHDPFRLDGRVVGESSVERMTRTRP